MAIPNSLFSYKSGGGFQVIFTNLSTNGPTSYSWDFGDGGTSTDESPTHDYTRNGFFQVSLTVTNLDGSNTFTSPVGVNDSHTVLSQSVYTLVNQYIPENITYNQNELSGLIQKWQLFIQPLVKHEVLIEDVFNEFAYEALENQLIAQLAAYDIIIQSANAYIASMGNGGTTSSRAIKKITTGPTDVEWFPDTAAGNAFSNIFKGGGAFSEITKSICSLSRRLSIHLPDICEAKKITILPFIEKTCP